MLKYSNFKRDIWESSTLSSRIISWILNIEIIINNGTFEFKKNFFQNIITQCNHLKNNIRFEYLNAEAGLMDNPANPLLFEQDEKGAFKREYFL